MGGVADLPDPDDYERLSLNWNELLQEVRVIQTGVQILTGFLLTVPFTQRFTELSDLQVGVYLAVLAGAAATTALVMAPAAFHRMLFRRNAKLWVVEAGNKCVIAGLSLLALTLAGVLFLVFDVVLGVRTAAATAGMALLVFATLWWLVPVKLRKRWPVE